MAEKAAEQLSEAGARIRLVTLTAKEKICFNPGLPCDPDYVICQRLLRSCESCSQRNADLQDHFDRDSIERFAKHYEICPFELGIDISQEADRLSVTITTSLTQRCICVDILKVNRLSR